jgi:hypothetical protein
MGKASAIIARMGRDLSVQVDIGTTKDKYNRPDPTWVAFTPPTVRGMVQEAERTAFQTEGGIRVVATHEIYTEYDSRLLDFASLRILDGAAIYTPVGVEDEVGMRDHLLIRATFGGWIRE